MMWISSPARRLGDEAACRLVHLDLATRSSVVRQTREISEVTMIAAMKTAAI